MTLREYVDSIARMADLNVKPDWFLEESKKCDGNEPMHFSKSWDNINAFCHKGRFATPREQFDAWYWCRVAMFHLLHKTGDVENCVKLEKFGDGLNQHLDCLTKPH
ncbi:hypothetical protein RA26_15720 [Leisingera sp. ANG-M7]|nr:hypothetical protein RA26_15720 [Leisingera sp. ANG-M7]